MCSWPRGLQGADFGSNSLRQTSYFKDNSWMSILHQYHRASGLKAWTAMCRSEEKGGNIFKMADNRFIVHVFSAVWGGGGYFCGERIWNNHFEIHQKSMQVIFIIILCTREYNSLGDPTRQYEADLIERLTACLLAVNTKQNSTIQRIRPNLMRKWPKWNEITRRIWLWVY